ncbi:MAG: RNA polymerase sigma factor ShbA [Micrococcales bacterium]|nr:MAG: RNA polymerase sigma factor ShbA [Micrococcales bacterium]PIE27872.1 MAG: RNA polymerase sigma factor ShbA [Micrococcales bacterium]
MTTLAVAAAGGHDPGAVEQLLTRVRTTVLRYSRSRLGGSPGAEQAAEDAAQEVCVNVLDVLPRYRYADGPFEALVYTLASRRVADQQRTMYRAPTPVAEVPDSVEIDPTPEEAAVASEDARLARDLLAQLPSAHRELLTLRIAVGMSSEEVARALRMTPGAVRVAQHRALQKLRALTEREGAAS